MSEHAVARHYGRLLGLLSGLFALLQVMISSSALKANALTVQGLQHALAVGSGGLNLLQDLVPVLVITYLSAAIAGAIMMGFAWYAGRLTALTIGRREYGAAAGFWVALWSGAIWLALSVLVTLVTHADGTISGIFTATPNGSNLGLELILLLLQNSLAALCGLGLGAFAGGMGSAGAPVRPIAPAYPATYAAGYAPRYLPGPTPGSPAGYPPAYPPHGPGYGPGYGPGNTSGQPGGYPPNSGAATPWPSAYPPAAYPPAANPRGTWPGTPSAPSDAPSGDAATGDSPRDPVGRT